MEKAQGDVLIDVNVGLSLSEKLVEFSFRPKQEYAFKYVQAL